MTEEQYSQYMLFILWGVKNSEVFCILNPMLMLLIFLLLPILPYFIALVMPSFPHW